MGGGVVSEGQCEGSGGKPRAAPDVPWKLDLDGFGQHGSSIWMVWVRWVPLPMSYYVPITSLTNRPMPMAYYEHFTKLTDQPVPMNYYVPITTLTNRPGLHYLLPMTTLTDPP